ncbi:hypothetical protein L6R52_01715 [Myxococcota bacterium]|nr:hypothetical protein [Myxococcota bacterium]
MAAGDRRGPGGPNDSEEPDAEDTLSEREPSPPTERRGITAKSGPVALPTAHPRGGPGDTLVPVNTADFAEEISDDLVVDAAQALRMIPREPHAHSEDSGGISLFEIGAVVQTRQTTQKIAIHGIRGIHAPSHDEDDTVIDLPDDEGATEELGPDVLAQLELPRRPTVEDTDDELTRGPLEERAPPVEED